MTPSERIEYIKKIAVALGQEDWALVDLTLKQFHLPWTDQWEGTARDQYIIDMIGGVDSESLLALAKHVGIATELESVEEPTFWQSNEPRLFISHVSSIKSKAAKLATELSSLGISAFVAHEDIVPTKAWESEIEKALSTMDALVALLSDGFGESNWTDQEVGVAIGRGVPVIPVKIDLDPYGFIGKWQAIVGQGKRIEVVAEEVRDALLDKPGIDMKLTETLVDRFVSSHSWANAKSNMTHLEKCRYLSPDMIHRLKDAVEHNSQVADAFGVPARLDMLIKKLGA